MDDAAKPRKPQPNPDHGWNEHDQNGDRRDHCELERGDDSRDEVRVRGYCLPGIERSRRVLADAARGELEHEPDRPGKKDTKKDEGHNPKNPELGSARPAHCSHLAVRRWSTAYSTLTIATMRISTTASAFPNRGACRPAPLVVPALLCSGRIGPPC